MFQLIRQEFIIS